MNELDFYAKVEEILGFDEAKYELYKIFLTEISNLEFSGFDALDYGCGSGEFAKLLTQHFNVKCIDKSKEMVKICTSKGLDAYTKRLDEINYKFDLITSSFDVLNYMDKFELAEFLKSAEARLKEGGYLMFDLNTLYGFKSIAQGLLHEVDEEDHLIVDANFKDDVLTTQMIYFSKNGDMFSKFDGIITQYYHDEMGFDRLENLTLVKRVDINLYSDEEADKVLLIFQKVPKKQ
ncbi:MAG: class I SAM-dependent methyltransferase [Campylobacter sp.]|nr:class I SAM-dependent methyltransferase [Campylobacter sp.]